jgi:hypothetical protein
MTHSAMAPICAPLIGDAAIVLRGSSVTVILPRRRVIA